MSLGRIRYEIDCLDREILEKLNERFELALLTKPLKQKISDRKREMKVFERVKKHARKLNLVNSDFAEKIFTQVIEESHRLQRGEK
jgi:chorismate mutase